jgi:NAD(P)-dependent dehydrogenase (short-subunit alcohol dehydrogenase family)
LSEQPLILPGGNNGIGFDTSYALAAASPNNHVIIGSRSLAKGEQALKDIQARNPAGTLSVVQLDVTDDSSIASAAKQVETEFGKLDVLVNNAGICIVKTVADTDRETLESTFNTNVFGPMILTNAVVHLLKKSKDPRIINVSSGMGSITVRMDPEGDFASVNTAEAYRMSKAALNMLTASQAYEYRDFGCKAFAFCPGYVITDLTGRDGYGGREWRKETGAESSETSAEGIRQIVEGERDGDLGKFVHRFGKTWPW